MSLPPPSTKSRLPPDRPTHLRRPRLTARLEAASQAGCRLLLASAPAGYGKTTLLAEWLRARAEAGPKGTLSAWLALDAGDDDPARFFPAVAAALAAAGGPDQAELAAAVGGALQAPAAPGGGPLAAAAALAEALTSWAAAQPPEAGPHVLALDDYHALTNPDLHAAVALLVERLPERFSLALATRADPPWPLGRLRARQQLLELRPVDLRLSPDEAAAVLENITGLRVPAETLALLEARTEGWAAALHLAALAVGPAARASQEDLARTVAGFSGSHRHLVDYLAEEVLAQQPPEVQRFLLQTSVLDRLSAGLCAAVAANSGGEQPAGAMASSQAQTMLERLEADNLFLMPLDQERRWYRYHPLFADFLRGRLDPAPAAEARRRAAAWHAAQGDPAAAVRYALAAADHALAARFIAEAGGPLLAAGGWHTVLGWLNALPAALRQADAQLGLLHAWALTLTGQLDEAAAILGFVEAALDQAEAGETAAADPQAARGQVAAIRGYGASLRGDVPNAIAFSRQALALLPEDDLVMRGIIALNLGATYASTGHAAEAAAVLAEARRASLAAGNTPSARSAAAILAQLQEAAGQLRAAAAGYGEALAPSAGAPPQAQASAHLGLGTILYEWNDLAAAGGHLEAARAAAARLGLVELEAVALVRLARVTWASGDGERSGALAQAAREAGARAANTILRPYLAALQARLDLDRGVPGAAEGWLREHPTLPGGDGAATPQQQAIALLHARALLAARGAEAAEAALTALIGQLSPEDQRPALIEAYALQALARQARRDTAGGLLALVQALMLAELEGCVRTFVDLGAPMHTLLAEVRGDWRPYALRLLEAAKAGAAARPSTATVPTEDLVEPLTARELEVLRLAAAGRSNREIAEALVVSLGTVKKHLNNVFGKLGARSRTQAIDRARALDLLP